MDIEKLLEDLSERESALSTLKNGRHQFMSSAHKFNSLLNLQSQESQFQCLLDACRVTLN